MENDTVEQVTTTLSPVGNVSSQTVTTKSSSVSDFFVSKTNQIVFTVVGIIDLLLLLRITFLLLGANRVGAVSFILAITELFVAPFRSIFASPSSGDSYMDVAAIVAIVMYIILGIIIGVLIDLFSTRAPK
jgi:hypothetical protein